MTIEPQIIGKILLKRGFRDWFLYLFKIVNGNPFIIQPLHEALFKKIQDIIDGKETRLNINLCPRAGKSTALIWLTVYSLTTNPKSQIIYTSFNQDLLTNVAQTVAAIMQHPVYKAMYETVATMEAVESDPIDDFWKDYLIQTENKIKFSNKRIFTPQGGVALFNSIGAAISGFGASTRNPKVFSGFLGIDDGDKPTEIRSERIRKKTHTYFSETLLSRLNNPNAPILNVQQRLHIDDLSGFLMKNYKFDSFKFPLLDENGNCTLGSQYTDKRIAELKVDDYVFQAQYQQEPIMLGGGVIKHKWWKFYQDATDSMYYRIFMTADTANKTAEYNDYSVIQVWGLTTQNKLRLLDMIHEKFEIPELQKTFLAMWEKWKKGIETCPCSAIYLEDKASGTQVIQQLRRDSGLPIIPFIPTKDKLQRVQDAIPQIAAGNVELPINDQFPMTKEFLSETDAFSADMSHLHDDICDSMTTAVREAFNYGGYF